jgi:hypothetical protein
LRRTHAAGAGADQPAAATPRRHHLPGRHPAHRRSVRSERTMAPIIATRDGGFTEETLGQGEKGPRKSSEPSR